MSNTKFADNYRDLSEADGVDAGFQFEFYCERCNDTWRTPFQPYRSGQASGWAQKAAGMFGGVLGGASTAIRGLAEAGFNSARDGAFKEAIEGAKGHFHRCAQCFQYNCASCFDKSKGLCYNCAPDVNVVIQTARAQGMVQGAAAQATSAGLSAGQKLDVKTEHQLVCPSCSAETHGAKFCPECGTKMNQKAACNACQAALEPGTKFCGECGAKQ
jgi:hypothetical protein